jgi:hypothetical protein
MAAPAAEPAAPSVTERSLPAPVAITRERVLRDLRTLLDEARAEVTRLETAMQLVAGSSSAPRRIG